MKRLFLAIAITTILTAATSEAFAQSVPEQSNGRAIASPDSSNSVTDEIKATTGTTVVVRNADGALIMIQAYWTGNFFFKFQTTPGGAFSQWHYRAGNFIGTPVVQKTIDGRWQVFFISDETREVWRVTQQSRRADDWLQAESLGRAGGGFASLPALHSNADGRLAMFIIGKDGALYWKEEIAPNGNWSEWRSFGSRGGGFVGAPTVSSAPDGRIEVFVTDGQRERLIWHRWQLSPNGPYSDFYAHINP